MEKIIPILLAPSEEEIRSKFSMENMSRESRGPRVPFVLQLYASAFFAGDKKDELAWTNSAKDHLVEATMLSLANVEVRGQFMLEIRGLVFFRYKDRAGEKEFDYRACINVGPRNGTFELIRKAA